MQKNLLLFWGWSSNDHSYRGLFKSAPADWNIYTMNFDDLMKAGWVDKLAESVLKFLEEKNVDKVSVAGHSLGGALALKFASACPERVNSLFLLDSAGVYGGETIPSLIKNFFLSHSVNAKKKAKENFSAIWRVFSKPITNLKLARYAYYVDLQEEAKGIKVPTILIWGGKDHLIPLWQAETLHKLIKGSKLIVLPKMDHNWPLYAPELFWKHIK